MKVLKRVTEHEVRVGGEQHSGWLPQDATRPLRTPVRTLLFNIEIQFDGYGYLLCYAANDGELYGDTWHETLAEAESVAIEKFGVSNEQWLDLTNNSNDHT